MGWFPIWGQQDPLKDIDPSLRKFLEKETPQNYRQDEPPATAVTTPASEGWRVPTFRSIFGLGGNSAQPDHGQQNAQEQATPSDPQHEPTLPQESLFQDGRYAHLWKTYRPTQEAEEAGKSDQEKLTDIVAAYKERGAELKRAAMENCAMEQMAIHECFSSGSWASRMTMCRAENRALEKCVNIQTKFLRALGYLSMFDRSAEENEKIQMHADKLYQRMLKQEQAIDEAKEKGLPLPDVDTLTAAQLSENAPDIGGQSQIQASKTSNAEDYNPSRAPVRFDTLPQHLQEKFQNDRFKDLEGVQLELAKRELEQDLAYQAELLNRFGERYFEERKERLERQAKGQERMTDKVKRWFDFRDWNKVEALQTEREHSPGSQRISSGQSKG
ncbi:MAG: hypothetical protein Q9159_001172 [Coniocarpon cinnabarinum]